MAVQGADPRSERFGAVTTGDDADAFSGPPGAPHDLLDGDFRCEHLQDDRVRFSATAPALVLLALDSRHHLRIKPTCSYRTPDVAHRVSDRAQEEVIFKDIVRRGTDVIQTQLLRYVTLSDALAIRFHEGMTRANTHSHDNPAADTVPVAKPEEFEADIAALEKLVEDMKAEGLAAESARPQMKQGK